MEKARGEKFYVQAEQFSQDHQENVDERKGSFVTCTFSVMQCQNMGHIYTFQQNCTTTDRDIVFPMKQGVKKKRDMIRREEKAGTYFIFHSTQSPHGKRCALGTFRTSEFFPFLEVFFNSMF